MVLCRKWRAYYDRSMFLNRRSTQEEYFDLPNRGLAEVAEGYRLLNRVNRIVQNAGPFRRIVPGWLGEDRCRRLSFLDLGSGNGQLGHELAMWAPHRGWDWVFTNLDLNPLSLQLNARGCNVAGSAMALPFRDGSFDVVIGTQMTHHLRDEAAVTQHFAEAWRVSREAVFIHDLHRNVVFYSLLWLLLVALRVPAQFRADGLLSVARGWRVSEFKALAERAGMVGARVRLDFGSRVFLLARKPMIEFSVHDRQGGCGAEGSTVPGHGFSCWFA